MVWTCRFWERIFFQFSRYGLAFCHQECLRHREYYVNWAANLSLDCIHTDKCIFFSYLFCNILCITVAKSFRYVGMYFISFIIQLNWDVIRQILYQVTVFSSCTCCLLSMDYLSVVSTVYFPYLLVAYKSHYFLCNRKSIHGRKTWSVYSL